MIFAGLIALVSTALVIINVASIRRQRAYVRFFKPALHYSAVQIICGDCSGEGIRPVKTFMDRHGQCERCGGASYVLASERGLSIRHIGAQRPHLLLADVGAVDPRAFDLRYEGRLAAIGD